LTFFVVSCRFVLLAGFSGGFKSIFGGAAGGANVATAVAVTIVDVAVAVVVTVVTVVVAAPERLEGLLPSLRLILLVVVADDVAALKCCTLVAHFSSLPDVVVAVAALNDFAPASHIHLLAARSNCRIDLYHRRIQATIRRDH